MGKINERCAGIDVGKRFLLCCVLTGAANEEPSSRTLQLRYYCSGPDPSSRMARGGEDYARGDGEHGFVLGSHIQHSGGSLCRGACESRGS